MHCPSHDWDTYCRSQELPEVCDCGKENWDEITEDWICKEFPGFCSKECYDKYVEEQKQESERERLYILELEKMLDNL